MHSDTLISIKNLSRYYGNFCAVNNINFELKRGHILGFLGPNGAGKTTTIQIITGTLAHVFGFLGRGEPVFVLRLPTRAEVCLYISEKIELNIYPALSSKLFS